MEEEITFLEKIINRIINFTGGNENAIVFASILGFAATLLLVIVTIIYVILVRNSNTISTEYSRFKVTDDLGKESEHEITNAIHFVENYYNMELFFNPEESDLSGAERKDFLKNNYNEFEIQLKIIYNYFSRVYLNYKYKKIDKEIFFDQLSSFITNYKLLHHDIIVEYYKSLIRVLNLSRFEKLFKLCYGNLWGKKKSSSKERAKKNIETNNEKQGNEEKE